MTDVIGIGGLERESKDSVRIKALGDLDELCSVLGLCRAVSDFTVSSVDTGRASDLLLCLQNDILLIQASIAGNRRGFPVEKLRFLEMHIKSLKSELPFLKSFVIPGETKASAYLDFARTVSRRAERSVVTLGKVEGIKLEASIKAYLNRLSSLLFVLSRLSVVTSGIKERRPNGHDEKL